MKAMRMKANRRTNSIDLSAGLAFLCGIPTLADGAPRGSMQTAASVSRAQATTDSRLADEFAGLDLTNDQKVQIDKIHQDYEARKAVIGQPVRNRSNSPRMTWTSKTILEP